MTRRILQEGAEAMINTARISFVDAKTPEGEKWPTLSEVTKKRRGSGAKTLRDTGRLMNSLQSQTNGEVVTIGSNLIYSNIHNYGGMAGHGRKVRIPQRRFLPDPRNLPLSLSDELNEITIKNLKKWWLFW